MERGSHHDHASLSTSAVTGPSSPTNSTFSETSPHIPRSVSTPCLLPKICLDLCEVKLLRKLFEEHADCQKNIAHEENLNQLMTALLGEKLAAPEVDFLYRWFDIGHDGALNAKEFIIGCSVLARGSQEDRIRYLFHGYEKEGFVTREKLQMFARVSRELEKFYGMPTIADCTSKAERISIQCFEKILMRNKAVLRCIDSMKAKITKGMALLQDAAEKSMIARELEDIGFDKDKCNFWEDGYDCFAAASSVTSSDKGRGSQSPSTSKESLSMSDLSSLSLVLKAPEPARQRFEIDFKRLEFQSLIGSGSFAEVYKGKWLESPVAIKVFEKSKQERSCEMPPCNGMSLEKSKDKSATGESLDFGESLLEQSDDCEKTQMSMCNVTGVSINDMLVSRVPHENMDSRALEAQSFISEVQLLTNLRHPNVLLYLGACTSPKYPFCIVSELIEGGSLYNYLHKWMKRAPDTKQAMQLALDIARGMFYLHDNDPPVLHRDLKSANILIENCVIENCNPEDSQAASSANMKAVIIDFGLSRSEGTVTRPCHGMIGSLVTMAPEVIDKKEYTSAADVYSYGILLWEIFTGRLPFRGMRKEQLMYHVLDGGRPQIHEDDEIPDRIRDLMEACWTQDQRRRPEFHKITAILSECMDIVEGHSDKE